MSDLLGLVEVARLAQKAVDQRGADFVYPDEWRSDIYSTYSAPICMYKLDDGTPGCIIAVIFPDRYFREGLSASENLQKELTLSASDYLDALQSYQDTGNSWGVSLNQVNAEFEII